MAHGLSIRGDSLYCPLSLSLDAYWNCLNDCWHCYLRRLNQVWGQDLRPTDTEETARKLFNGSRNKRPSSFLAHALAARKTIRYGNKTDPFQHIAEPRFHSGRDLLKVLVDLEWETVIQTMETGTMMEEAGNILMSDIGRKIFIVQPIISPGAESDWEVLERRRTTPVPNRIEHLKILKRAGLRVAVNGEPFIPGYHTLENFRDICKRLKSAGVPTYNTYNFHMNPFVIKRLAKIGLDIERIWEMNQDENWRPIQKKLCEIARNEGVYLGCPDFVNVGPDYIQARNTCCGVEVSNPTTYNVHFFKRLIQEGWDADRIERECWDGIGDREQGENVINGVGGEFYTMKDAGL